MHTQGNRVAISFARILMIFALVSVSCAFAFERALGQTQLCFPQVTGLPVKTGTTYTFPNNPPLIPGTTCGTGSPPACQLQPEADTGWFNAFRYTLETGTNLPNQASDGAFQAIAQGSKLYFSFEINNESGTPNLGDNLVLGFVNYPPSGSSENPVYTWIVIYGPFQATPANIPQAVPPANIQVWQGTSPDPTKWSGPVTGPIPWIQAGMFAAVAGSTYNWWVVVSIDNSATNGPQLPASGQFGIFLDAIRGDVTTFNDSQATFNLPFLPVTTNPDPGNPPPSKWATATLTPSGCSGVFITSSDITNTISGVPTDNISYTNPNNFQVKVHNSGIGVDAPKVQATFKIADFGLPAPQNWQILGFDVCSLSPQPAGCPASHSGDSVAANPKAAGDDVPAAVSTPTGSCADGTGNGCSMLPQPPGSLAWTLGSSNAAFYKNDDNQHQCVRVDLSSAVGTTTFINNSAWNNFQFSAMASDFRGSAKVSGEYPAVATNGQQTFHLNVGKKPVNAEAAQKILSNAERKVRDPVPSSDSNYLNFIVSGCRLTGKTLTIPVRKSGDQLTRETVTLHNCDSVGSYGYLIRHDGPVDTWNSVLTASGSGVSLTASPTNAESYTLVIPQGQAAEVLTNISPSTGRGGVWKWWWILLLLILLIFLLIVVVRRAT
jgi:hypothetical protein